MNIQNNRSPGRPRADERKKPTDQLILHAATGLFLAEGFQKVAIDDVAKKAGVTKATVYYYYESKANLFTETMVQMMIRIRSHMNAILEKKETLFNRLLEVTKAHLQATMDIDLEGFMRETKSSLSPEQIKRVQDAEADMYQALVKAFEDGSKNGEIPAIHSTFAAHAYISLLKVGNYRNPEGNAIFSSIEETADYIVSFFWSGIKNFDKNI